MEVFACTKAYRIPCASVHNAPEVINDPHMHLRGMLEPVRHPRLGEIVVSSTPLRLHGTDKVETRPSRRSVSTTPRSTAAGSDFQRPRFKS
jgi:crotonobetainyl-CoA:carnitine CoA-transferase CaiB-like acyl-CoA transferase